MQNLNMQVYVLLDHSHIIISISLYWNLGGAETSKPSNTGIDWVSNFDLNKKVRVNTLPGTGTIIFAQSMNNSTDTKEDRIGMIPDDNSSEDEDLLNIIFDG